MGHKSSGARAGTEGMPIIRFAQRNVVKRFKYLYASPGSLWGIQFDKWGHLVGKYIYIYDLGNRSRTAVHWRREGLCTVEGLLDLEEKNSTRILTRVQSST